MCRAWEALWKIVSRLRSECPWDRQQTPSTIVPYVVEEAYELLEAVYVESWHGVREEIGDILFQMCMLLVMADEKGYFCPEDPLLSVVAKLIRRHPHVFANSSLDTPEEVEELWERVKDKERGKDENSSIIRTGRVFIDAALVQRMASKLGFDWNGPQGVLEKLEEERIEITKSLNDREQETRIMDELGDLLFTIVNLARHLDLDPEKALQLATKKFWRRFQHVEKAIRTSAHSLTLDEMETIWQQAKSETEGQTS